MIGLLMSLGLAITSLFTCEMSFNENEFMTHQILEAKEYIWTKGPNDQSEYFADVGDYYQIGYNPIDIPHAVHVDRNYKTFLKFDFPLFESVSSATLTLYKASGNIERIGTNYYLNNPTLSSSKPASTGSLVITHSTTNTFEIDITNGVNDALSKHQNDLCISMDMSWSGGYGEFYKYEEGSEYSPVLKIVPSETPISNTYGNAKAYRPIYPNNTDWLYLINCYYYAIDHYILEEEPRGKFPYCKEEIYSDELFDTVIVPNLLYDLYFEKNRFGRILEHIDSPIYSCEWRIAMRVLYDNNGKINDFHFMKQTSTGSWCEHFPESASSNYENFNPETDKWFKGYNSKTVILAISYR